MYIVAGVSLIQFDEFCGSIDQGLREEIHKFPTIEDTNQEIGFQLHVAIGCKA